MGSNFSVAWDGAGWCGSRQAAGLLAYDGHHGLRQWLMADLPKA